jgi:ATP-dependent Clp protease adaptor protein ClpS
MSLTETLEKTSILDQLVEKKDLIVYNDDFNSFDHVIDSLIKICGHNNIQAEQCTWIIHNNGKCQVKRGPFKDLMPMCTGLLERGISAEIE